MSTSPLFPSYIDEKHESAQLLSVENNEIDAESTKKLEIAGLRVGRPTIASRVKTRWVGLTKVQKIFFAVLAIWLGLSAVSHIASHAHHGHGRRWSGHGEGHREYKHEDFEQWMPSDKDFVPKHVCLSLLFFPGPTTTWALDRLRERTVKRLCY